jgi:hypothetical protein
MCMTYSLLLAVRGAGMSHRTRRPYLHIYVNMLLDRRDRDRFGVGRGHEECMRRGWWGRFSPFARLLAVIRRAVGGMDICT